MAPPVYTDLNILQMFKANTKEYLIKLGIELGFEQFAINYEAPSLQGGKGNKNDKLVVPHPNEILLNAKRVQSIQKKGQSFKQLSRFTAVLDDASNTHRLGGHDIQAYDIIAVKPTNEKTFQLACSTLDVDIICLNFTENLGWILKRPMVKMAAKRGIFFEITYSPALADSSVKRNIISNALSLVRTGGGKSVILSSGSARAVDLRSPYDVINLSRLFGLSHSEAKDSICGNCRAVLKHAESRKTFKSVISVIKASNLPLKEQWILHQNRADNTQRTDGHTSGTEDDGSDEDNTEDDGSDEDNTEDDGNDEDNTEDVRMHPIVSMGNLDNEEPGECEEPERKKLKM